MPPPRRIRVPQQAAWAGACWGTRCARPPALVRQRDARLLGAIGYWAFDAAVLWAMLRAFGAAPALPVVALAYFLGQLANTGAATGVGERKA